MGIDKNKNTMSILGWIVSSPIKQIKQKMCWKYPFDTENTSHSFSNLLDINNYVQWNISKIYPNETNITKYSAN